MENYWNNVCLRIVSSSLSVSEISEIIGIPPSKYHNKGDLMSPRNPKSKKYETSVWILDSGLSHFEDIEEHLLKFVQLLENKFVQLKLLEEKCEMDIYCGVSFKGAQKSLHLNSEIIKKIALTSLDIIFDIYTENSSD